MGVPQDEREPGKHLPGLPASLAALGARATDWGERLATEGFWLTAGAPAAHGVSDHVEQVPRLVGDLVAADDAEGQDHVEVSSPAMYALARRMAERATYVVRPEDEAVLFREHAVEGVVLDPANVEAAAKALGALGVEWRDAAERSRAYAEAEQRAKDARTSAPNRALIRAADAGDLDAVKSALAAGADVDCPMPKDELPATPDGALRYDGVWTVFTPDEGLPSIDVTAIGAGDDGRVWAATGDDAGGIEIVLFDGARWLAHPNRDVAAVQLAGRSVLRILAAPDGDGWLATSAGLERLHELAARICV